MHPKLIPALQKIFWIIGWSVLALAVASIAMEAYEHFKPASDGLIQWPKKDFYFLKSARLLFSAIAQAFFAFLVSSVFDMIFHRAPVRSQQTESFLLLTCIGFCGEGLIGIIGWAQSAFYILPQSDFSSGLGILSVATYLLSIFSSLISFVYAATIYILYRHFSKMVTFEAEVV
jgi:hypothetical protein